MTPITAMERRCRRTWRAIASRAGEGENVERFMMLCYPRVFGYVFNPLTVYFGLDHRGQIRLVIYEVSNTFGERMSYVLRASASSSGHVDQDCRKEFHVSPFNKAGGIYRFRVSPIGDILKVAIRLEENDRTLMTAYFDARKIELTDAALMARVARTGWMTVKVIAAIHLEAAKLWLKGLRLHPRPRPPEPPISYEGR